MRKNRAPLPLHSIRGLMREEKLSQIKLSGRAGGISERQKMHANCRLQQRSPSGEQKENKPQFNSTTM